MLDRLMEEFLKEYEMRDFTSNPRPEHYIVTYDNIRIVNIFEFDSVYAFKSIIGPLPKDNLNALLTKIMEDNLFCKGTGGSIVGCEDNQLVLTMELSRQISYAEFCESLESFLNSLDSMAAQYK